MKITTFRAKSMQEAVQKVREKLGPNAAVLYSREVRQPGLAGLLGRTELEVAASNEAKLHNRIPDYLEKQNEQPLEDLIEEKLDPIIDNDAETETPRQRLMDGLIYHDESSLPLEQGNFSLTNPWMDAASNQDDQQSIAFQKLVESEIDSMTARRILSSLAEIQCVAKDLTLEKQLQKQIASLINTGKTLAELAPQQQVIAVVGPTGVGKTTTIAKLAAKAKFEQKKQVGLITIDTYRIAAVDQLKTYAEIMDLPMQVVSTPHEIRDAMAQLSACDLILIDTAGRSPRDEVQVQQLQSLLRSASPTETFLVLSATSSTRVLLDAAQRFSKVNPTAYTITKLDEVATIGNVINLISVHQKPINYITNGQEVPQAIELADPLNLAQQVFVSSS